MTTKKHPDITLQPINSSQIHAIGHYRPTFQRQYQECRRQAPIYKNWLGMADGREPQKFTDKEVIKRLTQSVNRIMFYVDQGKPVPADAIEFVRTTNAQIKQNYKG